MAVPTKLTDALIIRAVAVLEHGVFQTVAARVCGVSRRTWAYWLSKGKAQAGTGSIYDRFRQAVRLAETQAEINAVERIIAAGSEDVKHLQWWLERKFPERWGRDRLGVEDLKKRIHRLEALLAGSSRSVPIQSPADQQVRNEEEE